MKFIILSVFVFFIHSFKSQVLHQANYNNGSTGINPLEDIDSIWFDSSSEFTIIVLNSGEEIYFEFDEVENFTFSGDPNSSCEIIPTDVVDVVNPTTGDTWMDRNLGASRVANSAHDEEAYGDLYQWGRENDGHQCRYSQTTNSLSSTDEPGHDTFITNSSSFPLDWRNPQNNDLWQGVNGINNPCPSGYRVPTEAELEAERQTWPNMGNLAGAFDSPLKLTAAGFRSYMNGTLNDGVGTYWSSTISNNNAVSLSINVNMSTIGGND